MKYLITVFILVLAISCRKPPTICIQNMVSTADTVKLGDSIIVDASCTQDADMFLWQFKEKASGQILLQSKDRQFVFLTVEQGEFVLTLHASKNSKVAKDKPVASSTKTFNFVVN